VAHSRSSNADTIDVCGIGYAAMMQAAEGGKLASSATGAAFTNSDVLPFSYHLDREGCLDASLLEIRLRSAQRDNADLCILPVGAR
jgi:hypothetical protein